MPDPHGSPAAECADLFARLSAYLDGELSQEECLRVEEHLRECPPCIEFLQSLRRTIGLCRNFEPGADPPPLPGEVKQRLLAAFRSALGPRKPSQ